MQEITELEKLFDDLRNMRLCLIIYRHNNNYNIDRALDFYTKRIINRINSLLAQN